jgi:hypothetical protein
MYAKPDYTTFTVDGMDFNWCVLPVWKSDSWKYHSEENNDDRPKTF